ncbi:hypothetical protein M8J76_008813 [Diaphorina citri]|nr:hypothetical protein M8J76_003362 [Diaphorina citri]KAI5703862.1 hypothetical protein M8J76_008813 [Diaphorina citri]
MSSRLTCTGLLWTLLSLLAAVTSCAGFFSSSWLEFQRHSNHLVATNHCSNGSRLCCQSVRSCEGCV